MYVLSRNMKNIRGFYLKLFVFLEVKFSTDLHRRVFVMDLSKPIFLGNIKQISSTCRLLNLPIE